jgi:hypothetical protein
LDKPNVLRVRHPHDVLAWLEALKQAGVSMHRSSDDRWWKQQRLEILAPASPSIGSSSHDPLIGVDIGKIVEVAQALHILHRLPGSPPDTLLFIPSRLLNSEDDRLISESVRQSIFQHSPTTTFLAGFRISISLSSAYRCGVNLASLLPRLIVGMLKKNDDSLPEELDGVKAVHDGFWMRLSEEADDSLLSAFDMLVDMRHDSLFGFRPSKKNNLSFVVLLSTQIEVSSLSTMTLDVLQPTLSKLLGLLPPKSDFQVEKLCSGCLHHVQKHSQLRLSLDYRCKARSLLDQATGQYAWQSSFVFPHCRLGSGNLEIPVSSSPTIGDLSARLPELAPPRQGFLIFLSHRGPDTKEKLARPLWWILEKLGIHSFFDQSFDGIPVGEDNKEMMSGAAYGCRVGVMIFSPHFTDSEWCVWEANTFLHRHDEKKDIVRVVPVFFGCDIDQSEYKPFKSRSFSSVLYKSAKT